MLSTVLIIDKRKELSVKYKRSIEETDINAVIASTLKDAFIMLQELEPDMIIVSDSIEEDLSVFCQKMRALTFNTRPIIIALSKSAATSDRISVLNSGADDFLSEPVNIEEFKTRIKAHLRRDIELNLDNTTLLPNKNIVKKALKRVLTSHNQAVLLIDVKNLEAYTRVYTEVARDKILQTLVAIIKSAIGEDDFLGQYDEKSFVVVTSKYSAEKLASFLVFAFDTVAPKFYSPKDVERGYMLLKGERYTGMRVNFVSILIGGMVDGFDLIKDVNTFLVKLTAVKESAKIPFGSNYIIERVKLTGVNSVLDDIYNRDVYIKESDESLELLIRTTLEFQGYDIINDLDINSVNQPAVIIIDSGENLSELDFIKEIKSKQNFSSTKIIVTTTIHDKSTILNTGADLYLPKPYEISDLIRWVEYFIKNR